jgi:glycogen debranching enzyme
LQRKEVIDDGLFGRLEFSNLSGEEISDELEITVGTRFLDLFEVRGQSQIDRDISVEPDDRGVSFGYDPDDIDFARETHIRVESDADFSVSAGDGPRATVRLDLTVPPRETTTVHLAATVDSPATDIEERYESAVEQVRAREREWTEDLTVPDVSSPWKDSVLEQSVEDLLTLRLDTEYGPVLAAGTPWFATAFGRDSLLAAYQILPMTTAPAKGTLRYLAAHQATEIDDFRDAAPGKIFHEIRQGELTARGIAPHSPYYGTVDATALWIVLLHETYERTGDETLVQELWESLEAALDWLETHGEGDHGFLEYTTEQLDGGGLAHQAWKDSEDGIMYGDGTYPDGPIAAAEVQGYYYDALTRGASLLEEFDDSDRAAALRERADELQDAFDERFWMPEESFYAVALDGHGDPVDCVATNPGQCLWSGIVPEDRADDVVGVSGTAYGERVGGSGVGSPLAAPHVPLQPAENTRSVTAATRTRRWVTIERTWRPRMCLVEPWTNRKFLLRI